MKLNDERLSADEVRQIAALARISMNDEEIEIMRGQMVNILNNIDVLNNVDTDGVNPTGHSVDVRSVMRKDESRESLEPEDVLLNAPNSEDGFIRVRSVLD
ncbi:MAG: Asp-tRNA(Asn)/Glu-tRNA(Gln) amidotransferase subunit GatC [Chloroflexota bacterium]|nr:Asp-tRNA(Asn)/Glu-tRNA(Gln) amidotransferase subunit GatC [Chloroflexota bacterium]